jgi:hypothetical protein
MWVAGAYRQNTKNYQSAVADWVSATASRSRQIQGFPRPGPRAIGSASSAASLPNAAIFLGMPFRLPGPGPLNQISRRHVLAGKSHEGFPDTITKAAAPYPLCHTSSAAVMFSQAATGKDLLDTVPPE